MTIYEFEEDLTVNRERTFEIPGFVFMHDFVVTDKYYIFNQAPTDFRPLPFLLGMKGPAACINFDASRGAVLHIVPRDGSKEVETIQVDSHFNFHFANAYDNSDTGDITFDVVHTERMELGGKVSDEPIWETVDFAKDVPFSKLQRYILHRHSSSNNSGVWDYTRKCQK